MDGKGSFLDNTFVERLRRSLKYECVYLHARETGADAKASVGRWIDFYSHKRPHPCGKPPAVVCWQRIEATDPDQKMQKVANLCSACPNFEDRYASCLPQQAFC